MTKADTCLEFLRNHRDARVLMFSMYDASFALLERRMAAEGITFAVVSGSQARVAKLLAEFAEGKYNVLFLNARNMGAGLNIVCATHVLLYHKMSKELTDQIVGRGRTAPLTVVHLLHTNELDAATATA
jgi:SNF2 family DNA or RNA helicase